MKNILKTAVLFLLFAMVFGLYAFAADVYTVTEKAVLQNFDEVDDAVANMFGGSTAWGDHWVDTAITETAGLSGDKALLLACSEYGPDRTLAGFQSNSIGITEAVNDWTAGKALMFRVKNLSDSDMNILAAIDVFSEGAAGRVRTVPNGTQKLLGLDMTEAETVYTEALSKDTTTYSEGTNAYVVLPAGFDGYYIWTIGEYSILETPYEGIWEDDFTADYSQVVDFVMLMQNCSGKSLVIDEFKLVDFTKAAAPEETAAAETDAAETAAETGAAAPAAATGDIGLPILVLLSLTGAFAVRKTRK